MSLASFMSQLHLHGFIVSTSCPAPVWLHAGTIESLGRNCWSGILLGVFSLYVEGMIDEDAITRRFEAVRGQLDERAWKLELQKVTAAQMASLNIQGSDFQPEWNYTISPRNQH